MCAEYVDDYWGVLSTDDVETEAQHTACISMSDGCEYQYESEYEY